MNKKRIFAIGIIMVIVVFFFIPSQPYEEPTIIDRPKFIIAAWDYPDEYYQGIESFEIFENSTGFWVQVGGGYGYEDDNVFEWNASIVMKMRFYSMFNSALTGASSLSDGKNFQQHNISVFDVINDIEIFSQQNFTYFYSEEIDPPIWFYGYEVILNFLPETGNYYIVTVTYEIFYLG